MLIRLFCADLCCVCKTVLHTIQTLCDRSHLRSLPDHSNAIHADVYDCADWIALCVVWGSLSRRARAVCSNCVRARACCRTHTVRARSVCLPVYVRACSFVLFRYLFARKRVKEEMVFRSLIGLAVCECWNPGNTLCACVCARARVRVCVWSDCSRYR